MALDIVVAVDASGSLGSKLFSDVKKFLIKLLPEFVISKLGSHLVVFSFDRVHYNRLTFAVPSTYDPAAIRRRVRNLKYTAGTTVMTSGLREAKDVLLSSGVRDANLVPRVVVFVTDGTTFGGAQSLVIPAKELKEVYAIP